MQHEIVLQGYKSKQKTISGSQLLQNTWIIEQTVVLLWKKGENMDIVSFSFSMYFAKKQGVLLKCVESLGNFAYYVICCSDQMHKGLWM